MAYSPTALVTSHGNLLQQLETFLSGAGWTVNRSGAVGAERELLVSTHWDNGNGATEELFFSLITAGSGDHAWIELYGATGFDGSAASSQPGGSSAGRMSLKASTMTRAWFFATDQYCHVALEVSPPYLQFLHFGCLDLCGSATADDRKGQFAIGMGDGTSSNSWWDKAYTSPGCSRHGFSAGPRSVNSLGRGGGVRYHDGAAAAWTTLYGTNFYKPTGTSFDGGNKHALSDNVSQFYPSTGEQPIFPLEIQGPDSPSFAGAYFSLGKVPGVRFLHMSGIAGATEFTIGPDTWMIFPSPQQNPSLVPLQRNKQLGFAILKTV